MAAQRYSFTGKVNICLVLFLLIFSLLNPNKLFSQSGWYWIRPIPTGNMLYSIYFTDINTGYAAGALGTIIKTSDAGTSWINKLSGTDKDLLEIFFINSSTGFAVGKSGTILATTNGGETWIPRNGYTESSLNDITFTNKTTGYVVGLSGTVLKTTNAGNTWLPVKTALNASLFCINFLNENTGVVGGYDNILKTTNAGRTFIKQNVNIYPSTSIVGISYTDSNTICAAGNSPHGSFYKTTNGGTTWSSTSLNLPYLFGGSVDLVRSMSFVNINTGYIITDFGTILKTSDTGSSWFNDSSFRPSYEKLSVMYDINITDKKNINIAGAGGNIIRSTNSGAGWFAASGNKKTLNKNYFVNEYEGYCTGEKGTVLKTEDGGVSWDTTSSFTDKFLHSVFFTNEKTGYVAGNRGATFKTSDGGKNWNDQTHYLNLDYNDIYFINVDTGFEAGGNPENERAFIYKTTNGGINWYEVYDSLSLGILNSIAFIDERNGFAVGNNGNLLKTSDCGESWETFNLSIENLNCISFANHQDALIAATNGLIYKTTNSGNDWVLHNTGFYTDLNCIKFKTEYFAAADGDNGTIISSKDGGFSWTRSPKITYNNLYSLNIFNNNMMAFGEYGTIVNAKVNSNTLALTTDPADYYKFTLQQNYPNPFNPETTINYEIKTTGNIIIKIFDVLGKETATLVNKKQESGKYTLKFNGAGLSSGIYYYSLFMNREKADTKKMIILR